MLKLEHVNKAYNKDHHKVDVLTDFTLEIGKGEFVAIKGPSGCGKTTLLLIAGGLLEPDSGEVIVNNENMYQKSPEERSMFRAGNIGFVFQQYHLIPYLTVLENIMAPGLAKGVHVETDKAYELLERFGIAHRAKHVPGEMSVGEKQRVALARALVNEPAILLADEITGNLDEKNIDIVTGYLDDYHQKGGTIVLVTHDHNTAEKAEKIISL